MKSNNCIRKTIIIYACLLIILEVLLRELKGRGGSVGVAVFNTAAAGDYSEVGRCVCASDLSYKLILFHCCPSHPNYLASPVTSFNTAPRSPISGMGDL